MRWLSIAAGVAFVIDQASKYAVIHGMELARVRQIDVLPPVLNLPWVFGPERVPQLLSGSPSLLVWARCQPGLE